MFPLLTRQLLNYVNTSHKHMFSKTQIYSTTNLCKCIFGAVSSCKLNIVYRIQLGYCRGIEDIGCLLLFLPLYKGYSDSTRVKDISLQKCTETVCVNQSVVYWNLQKSICQPRMHFITSFNGKLNDNKQSKYQAQLLSGDC